MLSSETTKSGCVCLDPSRSSDAERKTGESLLTKLNKLFQLLQGVFEAHEDCAGFWAEEMDFV